MTQLSDQEKFQKNVKRWALFNPEAAERLLDLEVSGVKLSDGLMLVGEGENAFCCEDAADPLNECKQCLRLENLRATKVLYVFGVGAGYMFSALTDWLQDPTHQLVFLEDDLRVIYRLFESDKGCEILFHPQVWLFFLDADCKVLDHVTTLFVTQPWNFVVLKRYQDRNPNFIHEVRAKLDFLCNLKYSNTYEYLHYGWGYFQNFFKNLFLLPDAKPAHLMYGRFANTPAIICGAGPSLKKNLDFLETLKDKALIFAGGTAMNAVNAHGFVPHFGVGIDPNFDQYTRLITNIAFETPYFYRNRLLHEGLRLIHGEHLYVPGSGGYGITRWFEENLGILGRDISEGCNVVNFSLAIAAALGCNPIIFVGVDLAYSEEEAYASGIINHPIHSRREHFKTKNSQEELIVKTDIHGNAVYTLWKWVMESFWFSHYGSLNPSLQLINATEGGLGFAGIPNMSLKEVSDKFLQVKTDLSGLVHSEIQQAAMPGNVTKETIISLFEKISSSLDRCITHLLSLEEELKAHSADRIAESDSEAYRALRDEVSYQYFLKVFDEAFTRVSSFEVERMRIDEAILGQNQVELQKKTLECRRNKFLLETARMNQMHLGKALKIAKESKDLPAHPPSSGASSFRDLKETNLDDSEGEKGNQSTTGENHSLKPHESLNSKGSLLCRYFTLNGLLEGPYSYFGCEGALLSQTHYQKGERQGAAVYYYPCGQTASIQNYERGKSNGNQQYYYADGGKKAEISYVGGKLDGAVKLFYPGGALGRELFFCEGKRNGKERFWNQEGLLVLEAHYNQDLPIETAKKWHDNGQMAQENTYDKNSVVLSVKKWTPSGVLEEAEEGGDDYFDKVTKETGVITNSLTDVLNQITTFAPLLANVMENVENKSDFQEMEKQIGVLKEEMDRLKEINQILLQEAGLDPATPKEPLWKSPSSQRELELHVEANANQMSQGLAAVQISLANTLQDLTKKLEKQAKKSEDPPSATEDKK